MGTEEKKPESDDKKRAGKPAQPLLIIFGYVAALFSLFIGLAIGLVLRLSKATLSDSSKVYLYNPSGRKHGRNIIIVAVICSLVDLAITITLFVLGYNDPGLFMKILGTH